MNPLYTLTMILAVATGVWLSRRTQGALPISARERLGIGLGAFCGAMIGANDLWIASQALQDGSALVTDNTGEFSRVPGLRIENWLRSGAA